MTEAGTAVDIAIGLQLAQGSGVAQGSLRKLPYRSETLEAQRETSASDTVQEVAMTADELPTAESSTGPLAVNMRSHSYDELLGAMLRPTRSLFDAWLASVPTPVAETGVTFTANATAGFEGSGGTIAGLAAGTYAVGNWILIFNDTGDTADPLNLGAYRITAFDGGTDTATVEDGFMVDQAGANCTVIVGDVLNEERVLQYLTVERYHRGLIDQSANPHHIQRFEDLLVNSATFSVAAREQLRADFAMVGSTQEDSEQANPPGYGTDTGAASNEFSAIAGVEISTDGLLTTCYQNTSLTISSNLQPDYCIHPETPTAGYSFSPLSVTGTVQMFYDRFGGQDQVSKFLLNQATTFAFKMTDVDAASPGGYVFWYPRVKYTRAASGSPGAQGSVIGDFNLSALADGTNPGFNLIKFH